MAAVFLVCAGIPLATLSALTIRTTTAELDESAAERLRYEARTVTQETLGRLNDVIQDLDATARVVTAGHAAGQATAVKLGDLFADVPNAVAVRLPDGAIVTLAGRLRWPDLTAGQRRHLSDWGRAIVPDPDDDTRLLLVAGSGAPGTSMAATRLDEYRVLGFDLADTLPPDSILCASIGSRTPVCSGGAVPASMTAAFANVDRGATVIETPDGPSVAWITVLSLDAHYGTGSWKLALLRPQAVIRQPIDSFVRNLLLSVFLAALVVGLVSVQQVRRQLRPLEALTAATSRLVRRDFERPVEVSSGDEFQLLGDAFNAMSGQLRDQFGELEAFNIGTLTTLARAIDAKSHWTGGHSERVTNDAVCIGRAMDLPGSELDELRKGGLVHDVGKIATPPEILDKPAQLTPDEEAVMRLHAQQGVHILEPIPAFRPLLPIVGQHHEKWDGSGYPAGLAGTAIARTARVLAVADVYDALRSDRPYRAGLPHSRCVAIIREGAGTHFDPAVVAAFLKVEQSIDQARVNPSRPAAA